MITHLLNEISEKYEIPISTLKLNAKILKELNLISYGTASNPRNAKLSNLGRFIIDLIGEDYLLEKMLINEEASTRFTLRKPKYGMKTIIRPAQIPDGD